MRTLFVTALLVAAFVAMPTATAESETCKPIDRKVVNGVILTVEENCDTQADIKFQECVWGGYWDTTQAGPVTVRVYKCSPPHGVAAEPSVEVMGPCPSEKHLGVGTLYLSNNCYAQLDVKFYDCIWGGHWDEYGNKIAKVRVYSCDPYPPVA